MAYPFPEDWIKREQELKRTGSVQHALAIGPIAWQAYLDSGRRCTLEQAAEAAEEAMEVFGAERATVLSYLQFVEYTRELILAHLRDTTQSGSVGQDSGEQDPASS
jgi:hypothetical protein